MNLEAPEGALPPQTLRQEALPDPFTVEKGFPTSPGMAQSHCAYRIAAWVQIFILALFLASPALAQTWKTRVKTVLDGDTLVLQSGEKLRLRGIDAPEVRHRNKAGQYYGQESKKILLEIVRGQEIVLDRSELGRDRYGRLVGVGKLTNGRIINVLMVEAGAAFVYPHPSDKDTNLREYLHAAQRQAIQQGRGFWPRILSQPSASNTYVGTVATKRFHTLKCATGRKVKSKQNRFSSLRQAFEAGYAPARECTPWPVH